MYDVRLRGANKVMEGAVAFLTPGENNGEDQPLAFTFVKVSIMKV